MTEAKKPQERTIEFSLPREVSDIGPEFDAKAYQEVLSRYLLKIPAKLDNVLLLTEQLGHLMGQFTKLAIEERMNSAGKLSEFLQLQQNVYDAFNKKIAEIIATIQAEDEQAESTTQGSDTIPLSSSAAD